MALVADHHDVEAVLAHLRDFHMHLGHQRARRVEHAQAARLGFRAHGLRHAVRAENHRTAVGHFVQVLDEDRAFLAQILDDVGVVHDLVAHVDRRAELLDGPLDDLDRAVDAGAEAARLREQDFDFEQECQWSSWLQNSDDFHFECQRLASKRVIEIEQRRGFADFLKHAGVTAAARRIEFDQIAGRKILADHRVFTQRGQRHPLNHFRIAGTERLARH